MPVHGQLRQWHDVPVDLLDLINDHCQRFTGISDKGYAALDLLTGIVDQVLDFLCRHGGALCKFTYLLRDDSEALPGVAGARGFNTGV
ncbi:hypothetical protein LPU83_pLPU83d_0915 (plasmid) [Rhizobium favelukesii]|uniref:Uncharacterized protein n=1 Tax=Rhizobium favelukesii TaxID=348824 RepID=W6RQ20_9HYPH|nr:hypothetical protein LPU83_pLPU83d_0915 [Rhizobium favelukesii]